GRLHGDAWFALSWGAFPALTASWANALRFTPGAVLVALACFALSHAQRTLSTPVRALRRRTLRVSGSIERTDGSVEPLDAAALRAAPEAALRWLSLGMIALAVGVVTAKLS